MERTSRFKNHIMLEGIFSHILLNTAFPMGRALVSQHNLLRPDQGHSTDPFGKLSVRKAINPLQFSKGNFYLVCSCYGKFKAHGVFGLTKLWFQVPKEGQLGISETK